MVYLCRAVPSALPSEVGQSPFLWNEGQYGIQLILEMTYVRHIVPSVYHVEVGQIPCLPNNTSVDGFVRSSVRPSE